MNLEKALAQGGEAAALVRRFDWSATPLGPLAGWSPLLRTVVGLTLGSSLPLSLNWGPDPSSACCLYNDALVPFLGAKHPQAMGRRAREIWPENWDFLEWAMRQAWGGQPMAGKDLLLHVERSGQPEEVYVSISLTPIWDEAGQVCGAQECILETTAQVISERRERSLRSIADAVSDARTEPELYPRLASALATNRRDLPFALLYVVEPGGGCARLQAATAGGVGPAAIALNGGPRDTWALGRVLSSGEPALIEQLMPGLGGLTQPVAPHTGLALPVHRARQEPPAGVLVAGLAPTRPLDLAYRDYLRHVAREIATAMANVRAHQDALRRAEALAELDRAKSNLLSNVSHEFRTPLTLLLGPVEEVLLDREQPLSASQRSLLEGARRSAHRLLRLVNALLAFARVDAGRLEVTYAATDLARFTREIVSGFDSAARSAGLALVLDCPPLPEPVYVAPELWEQLVLNLVSNALNYTPSGEVRVSLRALGRRARLTVRDSGTGIPAEALPNLFKRFYKVPHAWARSQGGTGIGLALVKEIVQLHGGAVAVESAPGRGSTFTVELPLGQAHLPAGRVRAGAGSSTAPRGLANDVAEALDWVSDLGPEARAGPGPPPGLARERLLVAEDSGEMRAYLARLLGRRYEVELAPGGRPALERARARPPDLVLSDVLMPDLSGVELVRALRRDPATSGVPVILLSAQVGEDATLEALESGADDYLVKPFSSRELLARVRTHLELTRARREAEESRLKDAFLGLASHELRTPLTSLKLDLQATARELRPLGEPWLGRLARSERSLARLERLVGDLLDVSALSKGALRLRRRRLDLRPLCQRVAAQEAELAGREALLELPEGPVEVEGAERRLAQVLRVLLANAFKFSAPDRAVRVRLRRRGPEALLSVQDRGPGIPAQELAHLFDRFRQAPGVVVQSGSQVGLGMGLFIARALVELHGGRIWAESEPGRGSTFFVALPLAPEGSAALQGVGQGLAQGLPLGEHRGDVAPGHPAQLAAGPAAVQGPGLVG